MLSSLTGNSGLQAGGGAGARQAGEGGGVGGEPSGSVWLSKPPVDSASTPSSSPEWSKTLCHQLRQRGVLSRRSTLMHSNKMGRLWTDLKIVACRLLM